MEIYRAENVSFAYGGSEQKAVRDVSFTVSRGEFVTLCGKSGCGKTTLLRLLKASLSPHGHSEGCIFFKGSPLDSVDERRQAAEIGFVMQRPDNQIVTHKVWHELAFGLESMGREQKEIRTRVAEMASFFGMEDWFYQNTSQLSGGQKQLLALASIMVVQPDVVIADEPTSQLDPIAAADFIKMLEKINRELGITVILSEHRLEDALPVSDRVIVLDCGKIIADGTPSDVGKILRDLHHDMYHSLPTPMRVCAALGESSLTVREGRLMLENYAQDNRLYTSHLCTAETWQRSTDYVIETKDVWFRYEKNLDDVVKDLNLKVARGELFAIIGGNGTGKTTALSLLCGLQRPYRGSIYINGKKNGFDTTVGMLPQDPQTLFSQKSVYLELVQMLGGKGMADEEKERCIKDVVSVCRLESLLNSHPYDLSGGEMQRAALAKLLLFSPQILLLDEPTKGMDTHFKTIFADILTELKENGATVVMVSHDIEFCARYADRCAMFFDGSVTSEGTPREIFTSSSFYTTSACRMSRGIIDGAVTAEDIIVACGGEIPRERQSAQPKEAKEPAKPTVPESETRKSAPMQHGKHRVQSLAAAISPLITIPLTILFGIYYFDDRKYYFISLLIILQTLVPFAVRFEQRKPQARELVVISCLCAITAIARTAFFMLPEFKPMAALVIIAGVCLGGETGFVVGAVSAFVSNFFFGQGPWTPWQMFALGLVGFAAGLIFKSGNKAKSKIFLCIYGFAATLVLYGAVVNLGSVFMMYPEPTVGQFAAACAAGLPIDLVHALSTVLFLWFISKPMIEKLERIKKKYGI